MSAKPSSLNLRIISAVILMPVVLFCLIYGGWPFLAMIALALIISIKEWAHMAKSARWPALNAFVGTLYIIGCFAAFTHLRLDYAGGAGLALVLLLSIWASDTGAYFTGRTVGGPKLAPAISPNKTISGLIGGAVASAVMFVVYSLYIGPYLSGPLQQDMNVLSGYPLITLALIGGSITLSGQAGDLLESYEKRRAGLKDSGALIPGHGGMLDRIDSLLMSSVVFLLILKALGQ